jgi:GntR family transcriptional regulator
MDKYDDMLAPVEDGKRFVREVTERTAMGESMQITRKNPLPLYYQLKEAIIERIENEEWEPGSLIPTELELQKTYGLSRTTVRQALGELVTAGILTRVQGKGTFVAEPKLEPIRPDITGFTQDMSDKGYHVSSVVMALRRVQASRKLQRLFHLEEGALALELRRIRLVHNLPIGVHETYLNVSITPGLELEKYDFAKDSLYVALAREGIHLGEAEETVEPGLADDVQSELLQIPVGALVLSLTRVTRLKDGRPFEYARMVYRADKYK